MRARWLPAAGLILALLWGCSDSPRLAGTYRAKTEGEGGGKVIELKLNDGGQGSWTTDLEAVPFRWDVDGTEVSLHTKAGGVIRGEVAPDGLRLDLPGTGRLTFAPVKK